MADPIDHRNDNLPERAVVIATVTSPEPHDGDLDEMRELLRTARVNTVGTMVQRRNRPDAATYLGSGKLDELKEYAGPSTPR